MGPLNDSGRILHGHCIVVHFGSSTFNYYACICEEYECKVFTQHTDNTLSCGPVVILHEPYYNILSNPSDMMSYEMYILNIDSMIQQVCFPRIGL